MHRVRKKLHKRVAQDWRTGKDTQNKKRRENSKFHGAMRQRNRGRSIVFYVGIFAQDVGRFRTLVKPTARTRVKRLRPHFGVDKRIAAFGVIIAPHLAFLLRRRRKSWKPEPLVLRTLVECFAARQKQAGKENTRRANTPLSAL